MGTKQHYVENISQNLDKKKKKSLVQRHQMQVRIFFFLSFKIENRKERDRQS